ncbi:MAG TPA: hypothetical protein VKY74_19875, partial [Chloroflexia bacterium]|nr:hypothetical protein [Chloroflexia bacterium]
MTTNDVWTVGEIGLGIDTQALIEHWNGSQWNVVPSPRPVPGPYPVGVRLDKVAAITANDVWAVGSYNDLGRALVEHWDGASWTIIPSPNPGAIGYGSYFLGLAARATDDVWAVGAFQF